MNFVFNKLQEQATATIPRKLEQLGDFVAIDGSLIDAVLSMTWADYCIGAKKAKIHLGFNINQSIPSKLFLTNGLKSERPFVSQLLNPEQTGVLDRGYQSHYLFDQWQEQNIKFLCRIKASTVKTVITVNPCKSESIVFYDAMVLLGTPGMNQTTKSLRLVGYRIAGVDFWIATNRLDLTAEDIVMAYRLQWEIEKLFAWWKRHLKVYHLIARSEYGLMVQILSGLITYLLFAIYCHENFNEQVSIRRVRELRIQIQNESRDAGCDDPPQENIRNYSAAKT